MSRASGPRRRISGGGKLATKITGMTPDPQDARVRRTRAKVISVARDLLVEVGPLGLTYTLLGDRAGVTRQTLYRHWPTVEALLVDLVLVGPEVGYPDAGVDPYEVTVNFLKSLRAGMDDPTTSAALIALAAQADVDPNSASALNSIAADRRTALNILLSETPLQVTENELARLVGPIFFRRFIAHQPISDDFIAETVGAWLRSKQAQVDS